MSDKTPGKIIPPHIATHKEAEKPKLSNIKKKATKNSFDTLKITQVRSIKTSKYNKIINSAPPSASILTPGYRETNPDLLTIDDEVKKIVEGNDTDVGELSFPEQLCHQQLEVPDDNVANNYEDSLVTVPIPLRFPISNGIIENLPLPPGLEGAGPTSQFIIELFRKGIDINDTEERKKLHERLTTSTNDAERGSIEAYIRVGIIPNV